MPTAVEAQSLNHWTTGVVPEISFLEKAFLPKAQQERRKGGVMVKGNVKLLKSSVLRFFSYFSLLLRTEDSQHCIYFYYKEDAWI